MIRSFLVALVLSLLPVAAQAQTYVDRCRSDVEPGGMNLATALAVSRDIIIDCPRGSSIRITQGYRLPPGVSIEGQGTTLDAHGLQGTIFYVPQGDFLAQDLTIQNAKRWHSQLGRLASVLLVQGNATLEDVELVANEAPVEVGGTVTVIRGAFLGNASTALYARSEAIIRDTRFLGNGTGLVMRSGTVTKSVFSRNTNAGLRISHATGDVTITDATFTSNEGGGAVELSQRAGAEGVLISIRRSRFENNANTSGGGAITIYDSTATASSVARPILMRMPPARFLVAYSQFIRNQGTQAGAIEADLFSSDGLQVVGGIFVSNVSSSAGGAIAAKGRGMLVEHSLFRGNDAPRGAAIYADYPDGDSRWIVSNSLFAGNSTTDGGIVQANPIELYNVTIARNIGIGVVSDFHGPASPATKLANTIITENSTGNCRGVPPAAFEGPNLVFGIVDCGGASELDPMLDSMFVPALGSPVLAMGDVDTCRSAPVARNDIVFQSRATGDRCALGAFERPPHRRAPDILER